MLTLYPNPRRTMRDLVEMTALLQPGDEVVFNDDGVRRLAIVTYTDGEDVTILMPSRDRARVVWIQQLTKLEDEQ